ncbi:hypothetical protein HMPREF2758_06860 [Facklamia sp. HMSC062C11]|nr:hypothetical protein HMPREF2758_06860 [Facklamia sp. HMSC062C11]
MPVYNVQDYLARSIQSVLDQSYTNWELIITDDGSTDNSASIIDFYEKEYVNIRLIRQQNSGSGIARQRAIDIATGDYLVFLDPDDYMLSSSLENYYKILNKYPLIDVIFNGYIQIVSDKNASSLITFNYPHKLRLNKEQFIDNFPNVRQVSLRSIWNKVYSRRFIQNNNIKFTSQRVGQDALYNYEVLKYVKNVYINTEAYYVYDTTRENSAVKSFRPEKWKYELNIAKKFEKLVNNWNRSEFSEFVNLEYWYALFHYLLNISHKENPVSLNNKVRELSCILNDYPSIKVSISSISIKDVHSGSEKVLLFLLKQNMLYLTVIINSILAKLRSH